MRIQLATNFSDLSGSTIEIDFPAVLQRLHYRDGDGAGQGGTPRVDYRAAGARSDQRLQDDPDLLKSQEVAEVIDLVRGRSVALPEQPETEKTIALALRDAACFIVEDAMHRMVREAIVQNLTWRTRKPQGRRPGVSGVALLPWRQKRHSRQTQNPTHRACAKRIRSNDQYCLVSRLPWTD